MTEQKTIPLFSAARANAGFDLKAATDRVIDSHWYVLGKEVERFEAGFAQYVGVDHCVSLANGTDALELALRGLGVKRGDLVATAANAGFYSGTALHRIGAIPLYVDVDDQSLTLSVTALEQALTMRPAAVIATHLYGQLADVENLAKRCRAAGVPLIEDCAQSHGAARGGMRAGSFGDIGCFSFYPTKNLGALGDGGAVTTGDSALAGRIRVLRQYGWAQKYTVATAGGCNSRLDELQAAILSEKLSHLDRQNAQRRSIARRYSKAFASLALRCPVSTDEDFAGHLYVLRVEGRDAFRAHLKSLGISTEVHYPIADHLQPAYPDARIAGPLAITEAACSSVVSLPIFPGMTDDEVARVIDAVRSYFESAES
jgi:dTDP-3-amino-2,3,6-trideoxy-4-keto-D-glucose/dTDP-3-amino-3,4,6-trideoxy-alpha-D-glucose/dTDP-2,6-dideoxy-D-kanosamine transaminase